MQSFQGALSWDFDRHARAYHRRLPGFIRAMLVDHGISEDVIDRRRLGWDGRHVTVPIVTPAGRTALFERWDAVGPVGQMGPVNAEPVETVELYGWDLLATRPRRIIIAEGVREALTMESAGLPAISATGTGRVFKDREWGAALMRVPEVIVAFKRGAKGERRRHLMSRAEVVARILETLPQARTATWPPEVGRNGGAFAFFKKRGRSAADFERLL